MSEHGSSPELEIGLALLVEAGESRRELGELRRLVALLHAGQENILMALDAEGQAILKLIDAATTDISDAIGTAITAIGDLATKVEAGTMTPLELRPALQPALDTMQAAANALRKTATDRDPSVNHSAAPIPEIPPVPPVTE